jgi:HD-GYP domain-containing protein (c-di-GMP phosphodiesterase class II)
MPAPTSAVILARLERLNAIGIALSAERDPRALMEQILLGAKELTNADGGTVYSVVGDGLRFEIIRNDTLKLAMGGSSGTPITFPPVPLRLADGSPNHSSVVAHCVLTRATVTIPDAYGAAGFDFSGTRAFDARTGYRSISFLTVPMRNHEGEVIAVLQLINARGESGAVEPFSTADQRLVESLASQAATAATKHELIQGMRDLFESFVKLIATAIDEKSPYTGGHCKRVPELTMLLAEAAHRRRRGPLAGFTMTEADRYELQIAGWLHDCGKVTTPEWVMDKATKLHGLNDRIEIVAARFAAAKAQAEAAHLRAVLAGGDGPGLEAAFRAEARRLDEDMAFLRRANTGAESMRPEDQQRVRDLATRTWIAGDGSAQPLLTANEVENLVISRGTLTDAERKIINHHIVATIRMLESLPYPKHLERVPEFAGGHHERMDGKGYPKGLTREQMSVQARIMGIADVFEALTAGDRPYKKGYTLSQALAILGKMKLDGHIDPDLFDVFLNDGVWREYAARFLSPEQIDAVDITHVPGYRADA